MKTNTVVNNSRLLLLLLGLTMLSACSKSGDTLQKQKMLFSFPSDTVDVVKGGHFFHLESRSPSFKEFDTLRATNDIPLLLNDSQMLSESFRFYEYHKLLYCMDDSCIESNVFSRQRDSSHFSVTLHKGHIQVKDLAPFQQRYKITSSLITAVILALILELLILLLFFAGMHIKFWQAFHSLWHNILIIPVVVYMVISPHETGLPLGLITVLATAFLKALFFYFATHTVRNYRRFLSVSFAASFIAYSAALLLYYILIYI